MLPQPVNLNKANEMYAGNMPSADSDTLYRLIFEQANMLAKILEEEWRKLHPYESPFFYRD